MDKQEKILYTMKLLTWIASYSMLLIQEILRSLNHYLQKIWNSITIKVALQINFMKEVAKNNNGLRRELVKGSLEIYPIPGYGAMEIGEHKFCHLENGKQDCGTFKFVHIWEKKNGEWKISRVVSYDH